MRIARSAAFIHDNAVRAFKSGCLGDIGCRQNANTGDDQVGGEHPAISSAQCFDLAVTENFSIRIAVTLNLDAGIKMNLQTDPEWANGGALNFDLAFSTEDYTNEGSGRDPAQPVRLSGLDIGNTVTDLGNGSYRTVIDVSGFGFGSMTVGLEGRPVADLLGLLSYSARVPVRSVFETVSVEPRAAVLPRREVIDIEKCNACHDLGGAGLSFHGTNRTGEMQVCVLCHNPNATDIGQRPADPGETPDGKREEAIDIKRMIHQIHMGGDLEEPVVIYGFGGTAHDYAGVSFIGNNANCLTCHLPGTYSTDDAWQTLPSTVDTGADVSDPSDDLNISQVTAVCSSCHDSGRAKDHMVDNGGTFGSFDSEIATAAPEPGSLPLAVAALSALGLLARRKRCQLRCAIERR
jgi:OmcA/MtrC family decaheme c-type cytochrome